MNWQMVTALVALAVACSALFVWAVRNMIRDELRPVMHDIEVLRTAVFNHLAHGQEPVEAHIREVLGYGPRSR